MKIDTLRVPDATLHFELRGSGPLVALIGAPMDAGSFADLADDLANDHLVLTTDPRGINRSPLDDMTRDSTPPLRAGDLARLLAHVDAGPAVVFGSSGGAVAALALAQSRPELVRTVIAHEPPLIELMPDRDALRQGTRDMIDTYLRGDVLGAWAKFMAQAGIVLPGEALEHMFGGERDPQHAADERRWFAHELFETVTWRPDLEALRSSGVRIVAGIGEESTGQLAERTALALAGALAVPAIAFPGDHTGFVDHPEEFAARLRESGLLGD